MFDEPSSYLDVKQRLAAARMIRSLSKHDNYIIGKSRTLLSFVARVLEGICADRKPSCRARS